MVVSEKALFSVSEGASYLGLGRSKFLQLVYEHRIGSCVIGRRRLIFKAELDRFVAELAQDAAQ